MKLTKKIFIYSITVMLLLTVTISGYFFFMLSPLYAAYQESTRLQNVQEIQKSHIDGTFNPKENSYAKTNLTFSTFIIPTTGYKVNFETNVGGMTFEIVDSGTKAVLDTIRNVDYEEGMDEGGEEITRAFEEYLKYLTEKFSFGGDIVNNSLFKITESRFEKPSDELAIFDSKVHPSDKMGVVFEAKAKYQNNIFTNYMAVAKANNQIYVTLANAQTPLLHELQPIILQAMPVILLLCLLIILFSVYCFNRLFVMPITTLAKTTQAMKDGTYRVKSNDEMTRAEDEFVQLSWLLDDLYANLQNTLNDLKESNTLLEQKNKNQQVFLAASSHQLKTPIASSLLLTEGMIDKVGKFADTKTYLPKLRTELLNIKNITEEILSLDLTSVTEKEFVSYDLKTVIETALTPYAYVIDEKELQIKVDVPSEKIVTHEVFQTKILDNLIKNAIVYSPIGASVCIYKKNDCLVIENLGVSLDDELLPNIFEPFTRSFSNVKGSGLGLYIVDYFSAMLEMDVTIQNNDAGDGVIVYVCY